MTKIKICGCRTSADVEAAAAAGADFAGMVLAPNTIRFVPPENRPAIVAAARASNITLVCVLRNNPKPADPVEAERWYPGDMVQWHGNEQAEWARLDPRPAIRAVSGADGFARHAHFPCRHFLIDHRDPGSGQAWDWDSLRSIALPGDWFLAGGLHPDNVRAAIDAVAPWAVDVSTGVEATRGQKCPKKIQDFVQAVRQSDRLS